MFEQSVKQMHDKFGFDNPPFPKELSEGEYKFRCMALAEELFEYIESIVGKDEEFQDIHDGLKQCITHMKILDDVDDPIILEKQFDALLDLVVFACGAMVCHGFPIEEGFKRVMSANMAKELGHTGKRGNWKKDLVKPEDWKAPDLLDLVTSSKPKGVIILDGPDGVGKTTIAELLKEKYDAEYIHLTWSPEIEERMDCYMWDALYEAVNKSKDGLCVIDRHYLSEMIYAEVYREGTKYKGMHESVIRKLNEIGAMLVLCLPEDKERYLKHFDSLKEDREEMYTTMDEIYKAYEFETIHGTYFPKKYLRYDLFQYEGRPEVFVNQILEKM